MKYWMLLLAALVPLLTRACGQVITRVTPTPTSTPTFAVAQAATLRPTSTPAPYTPAPTATPTMTPTPVIYKLKGGDTLLGIAMQFNTTLEAIQEANGITDPRGLLVGQEIIIPQPVGAAEGATPTSPPTPMPFAVENIYFNRSPLGGLWCLGEIRNTNSTDLEQAAVTITLLDEDRKPLAEAKAQAGMDLIGPGERAPFAVRFDQPPAVFASYLAVPGTGVRGYLGSYYRDLAVRNVAGSGERYAAYTVHGNVANTGPEDAVEVEVTVTLYDSLGRVVGMRKVAPEHNVVPRSGETSFEASLAPLGGPVDHFSAKALGRRLPTPTPPAAQ